MGNKKLAITLRKNKIDLEHKVLLLKQQVILVLWVGFPVTIANFVISLGFYTNRDLMLHIITLVAISLGIIDWFRERNMQTIKTTQDEIDGLLRDLTT